jgi:hypothetical protein
MVGKRARVKGGKRGKEEDEMVRMGQGFRLGRGKNGEKGPSLPISSSPFSFSHP